MAPPRASCPAAAPWRDPAHRPGGGRRRRHGPAAHRHRPPPPPPPMKGRIHVRPRHGDDLARSDHGRRSPAGPRGRPRGPRRPRGAPRRQVRGPARRVRGAGRGIETTLRGAADDLRALFDAPEPAPPAPLRDTHLSAADDPGGFDILLDLVGEGWTGELRGIVAGAAETPSTVVGDLPGVETGQAAPPVIEDTVISVFLDGGSNPAPSRRGSSSARATPSMSASPPTAGCRSRAS